MHAVVSLFDEHITQAIKNLWTELANDFCVRHLAEVLPYPHVSYQIARHYDESQLTSLIEQLAHQATPFPLQVGGLALFTGLHPVLYVPMVRTMELSHCHQKSGKPFPVQEKASPRTMNQIPGCRILPLPNKIFGLRPCSRS